MTLTGQDRHFADQIDGLLERVGLLEKLLGGRWHVVDCVKTADEVTRLTTELAIQDNANEILQRQLKNLAPVGRYNGHDIEYWFREAKRLREVQTWAVQELQRCDTSGYANHIANVLSGDR